MNTSQPSQGDGGSSKEEEKTGSSNQLPGRDEAPFGTEDTDTSTHGVSGAKAAQAMGKPGGGDKSDSNTSSSSAGEGGNNTTSSSSGGDSSSGSNNAPSTNAAPSYVSSVYSEPTKSGKPHGKNITEGGFDTDDANNASFNSEIGGKDDPGRKAEGDFQKVTQSASGATGPRQGMTGDARGQGGFENLGEE